ncbi:hypothetical protein H2198_002633 [Neophaeococcomyces mojaviensis]|uniref:Uncharacterized protein n=1 Tax=Neophaeococcomyces mojaviensis TaxID=3383035 RepID=A0ACC3AEK3_9EURO|nr:hypothetical protein H2198_002633 [Knufia sp. JES_112]
MFFDLPASLRFAVLAACSISPFARVYGSVLTSSDYLDLVKNDINPDDYWTLTPDEISNLNWNLRQNETNGRSLLGSLDAPTYRKFIPSSRRRQTIAPWGSRTAKSTNPYQDAPDTGVVRSYNFTIARSTLAPDGVQRSVMLINGQFPGPTIEANWGDTISVTVQNNLGDEGTTLHWHGMLQTNTNDQDGVPGVTQCPIAPGQSFTYSFKASLFGTTWYHAHYSAQYTAGLYGAILVHGPTDNGPYDIDLGPILLSDYYYQDYYSTVKDVMGTDLTKVSPFSDNNLINGKGITSCAQVNSACTSNAGLARFQFQQGKTHRLRLINAGVEAIQKFSIDNHVLTVMAVDFSPVVPYQTNIVTLGVGQRVDVLVQASGNSADSVFMRSTIPLCSKAKQSNGLALVYYENADQSISPNSTAFPDSTDPCSEDTLSKAVPYYSITPPSQPDVTFQMDITVGTNATGNVLWSVNNSTFRADYNNPILPLLKSGRSPSSLPAEWNVVDFGSAKSVRLVINNLSPLSHPMHIHGFDMYILAAGGTLPTASPQVPWDGSIVNAQNPLRRDTFLLQPNGYMVAQIDSLNPGIWPFHCHIAWHVSGGLYSNFVTQSSSIASLGTSSVGGDLCKSWNSFTASSTVDQIDSGL